MHSRDSLVFMDYWVECSLELLKDNCIQLSAQHPVLLFHEHEEGRERGKEAGRGKGREKGGRKEGHEIP